MKPFELPGYEIQEKIGEGGMATVWKARQVSLDRPVAIKVLSKQAAPDKEAMERFRVEAQAAARINHHGIVQVYDAGQQDGLPYYVMEYIEGCSVGDLLERKGKLSERNALLIAEGVALGLGYAWEKASIIHCDVKPDNVMVERDGSVKVADLGLARFILPHAEGDNDHLIIGTPNYASPEQAQGVPDLDCRSDIYSLGAMLYHMVTGVLPFAGTIGSAAMDRHITDHLPDVLDLKADVSQALAWLIEKLMIKDRSLRPQNWVSVLYDLKEVKEGRYPSKLPEPGQSTMLRSPSRQDEPLPAEPQPQPRDASDTASGARRKIVISKEEFEQIRTSSRPRVFETDRALLVLLLLGCAAFAVYWFYLRPEPHHAQRRPIELPPRAVVAPAPSTAATSASVSVATPAPEDEVVAVMPTNPIPVAEEPAVDEAATPDAQQTIAWDNAAFAEGARLFNIALNEYDAFRKAKPGDPAILKSVERDCRRALNLFDSCKALAPPGVNMEGLISQCYRLLSDVRQSMLMAPAVPGTAVPAPSWSAPASTTTQPAASAPAAVTASAPVAAAAPSSNSAESAAGDLPSLSLSPLWSAKLTGSDLIWGDLNALLSPYGKAGVDLKGDPKCTLYGPVKYLMPVKEAARALNVTLTPGRLIDTPGFPARSFSCYTVPGVFEEGFNEMLLIADTADRVVGVQLVNDHPDALWLDPSSFNEAWHTHDFVEARTKAGKKWKIAFRVRYLERTLNIDSELVAFDERAMNQVGKPKERVMLVLPHQVVDLILARIEKGR